MKYQSRLSLKGQVMVNFVVKLPKKQTYLIDRPRGQWWILYVDRAYRVSGLGVGLVPQSPIGELVEQAICFNFPTSNNKAKYEAILIGLDLALMLTVARLEFRSDS